MISGIRPGAVLITVLATTVSVTVDAADRGPESLLVRVRFENESGRVQQVEGRVLVRAQDGGLLLEARSGRLWTITPEQLKDETETDQAFAPLKPEELAAVLKQEIAEAGIPSDIAVHETEHYVICSAAGPAYAQWCGTLLERLYKAFHTFWKGRDFELTEPQFPLPVVIAADQKQFAALARYDRTPASANGQGYYLITANRITLYDLTSAPDRRPAANVAEVARRARQVPASVATVIHEATHQIAFNTGMHTRYADNPVWLTEGIAMYFETPDLKSSRGWRTIGRVNPARLRMYRDFATKRRQIDSLITLLGSNERFGNAETAGDAYAEAWALTCFLMRSRGRHLTGYLKAISQKPPLRFESAADRMKEFQAGFGDDLHALDRQLQSFVRRLK